MSVFWSLVSHEDKKVLHLGTGRWDVTLSSEKNDWFDVVSMSETDVAKRLSLYFASWGPERLAVWARQITALMNGKPTVLINDSFESQERGSDGYKSVGILSGR